MKSLSIIRTRRTSVALSAVAATSPVAAAVAAETADNQPDTNDRHHKKAHHARHFRSAKVSWYGPGFYGRQLACGGTMTQSTKGVANKTLPCGTKVSIRHNGHSVRVPVVDRGPYVAGREFDLTAATKDDLRFDGVGTVKVRTFAGGRRSQRGVLWIALADRLPARPPGGRRS